MLKILFLILFFLVVYTYLGYAVIIWVLVQVKHLIKGKTNSPSLHPENLPDVCLLVTAYNENDVVRQKIKNSFELNYPKDKIQYLWMTDGSTDGTPDRLKNYPEIQVKHSTERKGKIHAINRGMQFVKAPIVVFSDSNTLLCAESVLEIVKQFENKQVGCVAGEKRIVEKNQDTAAASGEGLYWKMESFIKRMDAELSSAIGAAGELFAIRTSLYQAVEPDTILDDFIISLQIAEKGYKIAYAPNAYAVETASASVKEELKRKTRIATGGIQAMFRMPELLNPLQYGWMSFQYFSHKILRWTLAPIALFLLFFINLIILLDSGQWNLTNPFALFFYTQLSLYLIAAIGRLFEHHQLRFKLFFSPYYFVAINYASIKGLIRYFLGKQSVVWEKSKRA